ncbi:MAG: GxxExxY protein [Phycisphaerales bacterium]|nr:GxxExxY protein [Phycisphaerales bacterium]
MLELQDLSEQIIGAALEVHRELGPGLLEGAYEACLCHALAERGVPFARQVELPVTFRGTRVDCGFRIDVLVDARVVVELKAIEKLLPIHEAQLMTYLRLGRYPVGLLFNFNSVRLMDAFVRRANTASPKTPPRSPRPPR